MTRDELIPLIFLILGISILIGFTIIFYLGILSQEKQIECLELVARVYCLEEGLFYVEDSIILGSDDYFKCRENTRDVNGRAYLFLDKEVEGCER